jgi:hypothetical protein
LILGIILSNCDISVKKANAQTSGFQWTDLNYQDCTVDGMQYRAFLAERGSGGTSLFIINITKEKLEIELLKKQLLK